MLMKHVLDPGKRLDALKRRTTLDLNLNDIRIILGCFRAVAYQGERDGEQYLDADALELKSRLETEYEKLFKENGHNGQHAQ
jgi:hypothetical protein